MRNRVTIPYAFAACSVAPAPSANGFLPQSFASDNISRKSLGINTSTSVDSTKLKVPQNQHLQKTQGEGSVIVNQQFQSSAERFWMEEPSPPQNPKRTSSIHLAGFQPTRTLPGATARST